MTSNSNTFSEKEQRLIDACRDGRVDDALDAIKDGANCNVMLDQKYPVSESHGVNEISINSVQINLIVLAARAAIGRDMQLESDDKNSTNYKYESIQPPHRYIAIINKLKQMNITAPAVQIGNETLTLEDVLDEQEATGNNCKEYPQRLYFIDPRIAKYLGKQIQKEK